MKNNLTSLLFIDASPRGERSQSRKLGQDFLASWRRAHPDAVVVTRDIGAAPPPFVSAAWVEGAFTPAEGHSEAAKAAMVVSDEYADELLNADEIVITTPMYNLSIPAVLKAWIDQVVRAGRTFTMNDGQFEGLAKNKRAIVIVASGSDFRPGSPGGSYNFVESYLRAIFGFIGITDVQFVYAHSLNRGNPAGPVALVEARETLAELAHA